MRRSRLREWSVRIVTHNSNIVQPVEGEHLIGLRVQSIALHTAVERALERVWPDREAPIEATIEVWCLEPKFRAVQQEAELEVGPHE